MKTADEMRLELFGEYALTGFEMFNIRGGGDGGDDGGVGDGGDGDGCGDNPDCPDGGDEPHDPERPVNIIVP